MPLRSVPFQEELAQQTVGVLVRAALPGSVRIAGWENVDLQTTGQFRVAGHLRSAVVCPALAQCRQAAVSSVA